jgi:hypothetical protein
VLVLALLLGAFVLPGLLSPSSDPSGRLSLGLVNQVSQSAAPTLHRLEIGRSVLGHSIQRGLANERPWQGK